MLQPPKKTELSTCWKALQSCSKGVNFTLQHELHTVGCQTWKLEAVKFEKNWNSEAIFCNFCCIFSCIYVRNFALFLRMMPNFCVLDCVNFRTCLHSFAIYACTLATRLFSSLVWYWALLLKACYWPRIENFLQEPLVRFCLFLSRSARIAFRHWFFWQSIYVIFCLLSIKRKQKFQHPAWSLLGIRCLHLLTPCFLGCILQRNC